MRGGPGFEFWTPGDEYGGAWGSGKNWPLDPPAGGPLPTDPYLKKMWLTFWGGDMARLSPSNRRAVVPGGWRIEVSPAQAAREDVFLHALEIGDKGAPTRRIEAIDGPRSRGRRRGGRRRRCSSRPSRRRRRGRGHASRRGHRLVLIAGLEPRALLRPAAHVELRAGLAALALHGRGQRRRDRRRALGAEGRPPAAAPDRRKAIKMKQDAARLPRSLVGVGRSLGGDPASRCRRSRSP